MVLERTSGGSACEKFSMKSKTCFHNKCEEQPQSPHMEPHCRPPDCAPPITAAVFPCYTTSGWNIRLPLTSTGPHSQLHWHGSWHSQALEKAQLPSHYKVCSEPVHFDDLVQSCITEGMTCDGARAEIRLQPRYLVCKSNTDYAN